MAWNSVYETNDKAVHLLINVGGKAFNFTNGVDIKVERKIGDTMSKFSLGIVGDDSDSFYDFEQRILRLYTEIKISYGNSSKSMSSFVGMVVDYQPVFLGPSTKLTITGYLSKVKQGVSINKLTSAYTYWIDWVPLIGVRKDETQEWAEIYNGNFRFDSDMSVEGLDAIDDKIINQEEADRLIEEYISKYDEQIKAAEANLLSIVKRQLNSQTYVYSTVGGDTNVWANRPVSTNGGIEYVKLYGVGQSIMNDGSVSGDVSTYLIKWGGSPAGVEDLCYVGESTAIKVNDDLTIYSSSQIASVANAEKKYVTAISKKAELELKLRNIYSNDTWGSLSGVAWDYGHVPWSEAITHYDGNVVFSKYTNKFTQKSIYRVRPDLFIEWDNELPGAPEYYEDKREDGRNPEEKAKEFPDWAINDIKIFGLKYSFNKDEFFNNPSNPYSAYTLSPNDMHGKRRIYLANNKYYIWVSDVPSLYNSWKASDWKWNEKDDPNGRIYQDGQAKQWAEQTKYQKGAIITNNWSGWQTVGGGSERKHKVQCSANGEVAKATRTFTSGKYEEDNWDFLIFHGGDQTLEKDVLKVKALNSIWEDAKEAGDIEVFGSEAAKYGDDYHHYKITGLEANPKEGVKAMTPEERITAYLQAAFRSGDVLGYGQVYISDIVAQLCELEGWGIGKIVKTAPSSYKSSWLAMNGMTALEYISTVLTEHAIEADGMGRSGFRAYFTGNNLNFEPANLKKNSNSIVLTMGYNQKDTPVLSFTVRSRGQLLMAGIDEDVSSINAYSNEAVSAMIPRSDRIMTSSEKELYDNYLKINNLKDDSSNPVWFNASWFNYYGYEKNVTNYTNFTKSMSNGAYYLSYGDGLIQKAHTSSVSTSGDTLSTALKSLDSLRSLCIQAELTMLGDENIAPGQWITVNNITLKGNHYTSGDYYIQSITDQVSTSSGFTQNLTLWRYSRNVYSYNNDITPTYIKHSSINSRLELAGQKLKDGSFDKWYDDNADFNEIDLTDTIKDTIKDTSDKNIH